MTLSKQERRIVLFCDVDGTLLGPRGGLAVAPSRAQRLAQKIDIVLASSRTLEELLRLQKRLGIVAPLAAENGAVLAFPLASRNITGQGRFSTRGMRWMVEQLGSPLRELLPLIRKAAAMAGVDWREVAPRTPSGGTGRRSHSVLLRPGPSPANLLESLRSVGLEATLSGRWITVTKGADKGRAVRRVLACAEAAAAPYHLTAAIGDAANDATMLRVVMRPFVIRVPARGHHPELAAIAGAILLRAEGLLGFREAVKLLLREVHTSC